MNLNPIEVAKSDFKKKVSKGQLPKLEEININSLEDKDLYTELFSKWYHSIMNLSELPDIESGTEEIMIHGPLNIQKKTRDQKIQIEIDMTKEDLNLAIEIVALKSKQDFNYQQPFCSFNTKFRNTPVRISLIHHSTGTDKTSKMFIRILNSQRIPLRNYTKLTNKLIQLVTDKKNIIISGSTGSGKTTFTNSLLSECETDEHIIILEDTKELIAPNKNSTNLISDANNPAKSLKNYLTYSLRMSPDRIILGEIRGAEVEPALLALNTGHNGLISTVHANSAQDAIHRLSLLFKLYSQNDVDFNTILALLTKNIDYVIHLENKKIKEIIQVYSSENDQIFYEEVEV